MTELGIVVIGDVERACERLRLERAIFLASQEAHELALAGRVVHALILSLGRPEAEGEVVPDIRDAVSILRAQVRAPEMQNAA